MPYRLMLLAALVLTGCGQPADPPRRTRAEREQAAEALLSRTPEARSYRFDGNELKVIDVPVKDFTGQVDVQRCFVWRDQEYRTATLSCGQQPEILPPN